MKLRLLEFEQFESYKNKQKINFDELQGGLFAIIGNTGAGKTTIFDAIMYALFGTPSGDRRDEKMLRCKTAKDDEPTRVYLKFDYQDKTYELERTLKFVTKKGKTEKKTDFSLKEDGNVFESNEKELNKRVCDIIGVTRDEFRQIVMISQGDFAQLIDKSTKDKLPLYRKIFGTEIYSRFQDEMKSLENVRSQEFESTKELIEKMFEDVKSNDEAMNTHVNEQNYADAMDDLVRVVQSEKQAYDKMDGELKSLDERIVNLEKMMETGKALADATRNLPVKLQEKAEVDAVVNELTRKKAEADAHKPELESLLKEEATMTEQMKILDMIFLKKQEVIGDCLKERKMKEDLARTKTNHDNLLSDKAKLDEEVNSLGNPEADKSNLANKIDKCKTEKEALRGIGVEMKKYVTNNKSLETKQNDVVDKTRTATEKTTMYNRLLSLFLSEQAGILAEKLVDNLPCPVCGSTSHPMPAMKLASAPDEATVKTARSEMERAGNDASEAARQAAELKATVEEQRQNLETKTTEVMGQACLDINRVADAFRAKEAEISRLTDEMKEMDRRIARLKTIATTLMPGIQKNLELALKNKSALETSLAEIPKLVDEKNKEIEKLKSGLKYESDAQAKERMVEIDNRKSLLQKAMDDAKTNLDKAMTEKNKLEGEILGYRQTLEGKQTIDMTAVAEQLAKARMDRHQYDNIKDIYALHNTHMNLLQRIEKEFVKFKKIEEEWKCVKSLSDTVNGKVKTKAKLQLETFVLSHYLEKILVPANVILDKLTKGQYELVRRTESTGNAQSGLDLDVVDHYEGTQREVQSLSGGESFKAALALSLGLSNHIQMANGGIIFDTMFIDEGFGSLDEESLDLTKRIMMGQNDSGRLIGVISHVEALRGLDKRIEVVKDKDGSHAKVVVD